VIKAGHIALFPFPHTNQSSGKLRPALVLRKCPGPHEDWLICMISSRLQHEIPGTDLILSPDHPEYVQSGLKVPSVIRATRLAVVTSTMLQGAIGQVPEQILAHVRRNISNWIVHEQ
jgi:mRNA interferase MazF